MAKSTTHTIQILKIKYLFIDLSAPNQMLKYILS